MVSYEDLKATFGGLITQPGDEDYSITRFSSTDHKEARYVMFPRDAHDVSLALRFTVSQKLDLAIAGGKHGSFGQASTQGGVVIDMSKFFNNVVVDAENKVAFVQGGTKMGSLVKETSKYGLSAVAGHCTEVGVVGHLIGGGYGVLAGKYGLALDNLLSAKMVLADGSTVTASDSENSDLFWAIRGGGSNFGVITEVQIKLYEQRADAYMCDFIWTREQLPILVREVNEWRKTQPVDELGFVAFCKGPQGPIVLQMMVKNADQAAGEASFKRFADLNPIAQVPRQAPWEQVCALADPFAVGHSPRLTQGTFVKHLYPGIAEQTYDEWLKVVSEGPASLSAVMYEFYSTSKIAEIPVDATAYACRVSLLPVLTGAFYPSDANYSDEDAKQVTRRLKAAVEIEPSDQQDGSEINKRARICGYPNYADQFATGSITNEDYSWSIFGPNYPRLQQIKKKYDPTMVFNKWFAIRPAGTEGAA